MIRGVLKRQTGISLIGVRMSNCIADLPLCSSQIKMNRKYDLPDLEQGPEKSQESKTTACTGVLLILLYETVEACRADNTPEAGS
jgi:hypothetical protein